jgi:hypothetical protein
VPVSNASWDGSPSRWDSVTSYCASCLIDRRTGGGGSKADCSLPVREPGGAINRNAVHAAAAALAGGRGGVSASAEQKAMAARKLVRMYRNDLNEDPPESLMRMAGN